MKELVTFNFEEASDFIFTELVECGLVPDSADVEIITNIFVEYLFFIGMMQVEEGD